ILWKDNFPFLRSFFPTGKLIAAEHWLAPDSARVSFIPRPPDCHSKLAGDSRRLTRRGQEKNVEERVPVFTQHTQLFHKYKIRERKDSPSRNCNDSWKKIRNRTTNCETFTKHLL